MEADSVFSKFGSVTWRISPPPGEEMIEDQLLMMRAEGLPIQWTTMSDGTALVTMRRPFAGIGKIIITQRLNSLYPGYQIIDCPEPSANE